MDIMAHDTDLKVSRTLCISNELVPANNLFEARLMELLRERAHEKTIAPFVVGTRKEIVEALLGKDPSILRGERGKLLGYKIHFLIQQHQKNPEGSLILNQIHVLLLEATNKPEPIAKQQPQANNENLDPQRGKR